jgi:aspartyl-tRNA(Asn)/glutamyl-tRNA(Gln) amidotransferase subunit A
MVPAALGTDTGGSLRVPASFCGVSSIKPTRGRTSIDGVVPFGYTFDTVGPMGRTLADCGMVLAAMAGPYDQIIAQASPAQSIGKVPVAARSGSRPLAGVRIAMTQRTDLSTAEPDVVAGLAAAQAALARLGATIVALDIFAPELIAATGPDWVTITRSDMWSYHRNFVGEDPSRYRPSIRGFLGDRAAIAAADEYSAAQQRRDNLAAHYDRWLTTNRIDAVLEATTLTTAVKRGIGGQPAAGTSVRSTASFWNLVGAPTVSLPTGLGAVSSLPTGVVLIGRRGGDAALLQIGIDLQEHAMAPPVLAY